MALSLNNVDIYYPVKNLSDVAHFLDNLRRPVKESERVEGNVPYYGANGQQGTINQYIFDEPLILLAEDGGHFNNPERGIAYQIFGKTWVNNHAHVLKAKDVINHDFLFRVLQNYDIRPLITGTTRGKLTKEGASKIKIPLPPLREQIRIAAILDKAAGVIEARKAALKTIDALKASLFIEMFGNPVTNPMGWDMGKISDLTKSTQYGTSAPSTLDGTMPILRMGNIQYNGDYDLQNLKYITLEAKDLEKYTVKRGDILFNRTNSPELVGKTGVFYDDGLFAFAGYLVRLRVNEKATPEYISGYLNSVFGKEILRGMCKAIVGMANINAKELIYIKIPLPPLALQITFAQKITTLNALKAKHTEHLAHLTALFAALQNKAFRGEL